MLVELSLVEQRYQAVLEVLNGVAVVELARRYGVARQTVHDWLRRYGCQGMAGLVDRSSHTDTSDSKNGSAPPSTLTTEKSSWRESSPREISRARTRPRHRTNAKNGPRDHLIAPAPSGMHKTDSEYSGLPQPRQVATVVM